MKLKNSFYFMRIKNQFLKIFFQTLVKRTEAKSQEFCLVTYVCGTKYANNLLIAL